MTHKPTLNCLSVSLILQDVQRDGERLVNHSAFQNQTLLGFSLTKKKALDPLVELNASNDARELKRIVTLQFYCHL